MIGVFNPSAEYHWSWVTLAGPDAKDFLHRLTTVNVGMMEVGQGAPGCFLNPQGRIRAYFALWNYRPDEYAFELDAGATGRWKQELLSAIDQYTFAEKIAVVDPMVDTNTPGSGDPLACLWIVGDAADMPAVIQGLRVNETLALDAEIRVCHHGEADFGRAWVTAWGRSARLSQWRDQWLAREAPTLRDLTAAELESWRIEAVRPRVDAEITGPSESSPSPLEIGLPDAIASNKGCYPGQEVIEKVISLGSPARRLALIEGAGAVPARGQKLHNLGEPAAEIGELTSVAATSQGYRALAVLRKIHAKEGLEVRTVAGQPARIVRIAPYA